MTTKDDRKEFESHRQNMILSLAKDPAILRQSTELFFALNKYDYSYLWSWMGVPIIQIPPDIMATQEAIWNVKPDVIIETGVARGGSLIFMASILAATGKPDATVIGVDIDIRDHNRDSIESHPMSDRITLIQGGSVDAETLKRVKAEIPPGASVMVVLDSDHSRDHVLAECRAYGPLVTLGSYLVVADTVVGHLPEGKSIERSKAWHRGNDPLTALQLFLEEDKSFAPDEAINGKLIFSSSPGGYCKKIAAI